MHVAIITVLFQLMYFTYTIKHQLTLTFKTLKNVLKTFWWDYPYMFLSTHSTIFRGRSCRTLYSY